MKSEKKPIRIKHQSKSLEYQKSFKQRLWIFMGFFGLVFSMIIVQ